MRFRAEHYTYRSISLPAMLAVAAAIVSCSRFSSEGVSAETAGPLEGRSEQIADALKKNGPIFVDWPKPEFCLVFSGEMDGYLEPCGCAGLENQLGGMKRRHTFLKRLAADGWNPVAFDMGGEVRRTGPQAEMKYRYAIRSLVESGYAAVAIGMRDLHLSSEALLYVAANLSPEQNPLVSANVDLFGMAKPFKVIEVVGQKIGVTAVLGKKFQQALADNGEITVQDPAESLQKVAAELRQVPCDYTVLLVHGVPEEAADFARQFPQFDFVGTTGGAETPPNRSKPIEGTEAHLIETGHKGQYVCVIGIFNDPEMPIRFQRVPLDHRFEDSPEMQRLFVEYQKELETTTLSGLGLTGTKHPVDSFAGSTVCADCHTQASEVFNDTAHAHATATLTGLNPPRQYDPECLSCHVTGWNPQEFFPYASGYMGLKQTPLMTDNGCENCHGPAAAHVAAESGEEMLKDREIEALRASLRLKIVENEGNMNSQVAGVVVNNCLECHDIDNSPDFDFQAYWPKVEHHGKD